MSKNIEHQYLNLLQDILDNGVTKQDRTGTGTISVFGRQIRHKMKEGFPLLTTKKMYFKGIVTELLWFLRGDTNIKYLVDNDCNIWTGDAYKAYDKWNDHANETSPFGPIPKISKEDFIKAIKTNDEFAKQWGELGPIYGAQWRSWNKYDDYVDQIANLIQDLKTNPDSRRLMVNVWNVGELDQMTLPPCHYGFQCYTRELSVKERMEIYFKQHPDWAMVGTHDFFDKHNIPKRAISLMWNQRSVDTFLGLPFNIASYGLLLEIIAKEVNMVPDELIGNLGDVHLYNNHIEQAKEQIGRDLTLEERLNMVSEDIKKEFDSGKVNSPNFPNTPVWSDEGKMSILDDFNIPRRTREPFELPKLKIDIFDENNHYIGDMDDVSEYNIEQFKLENYRSHLSIKAKLSN